MKNATFVSVLLTLLIASLFFAVSAGPALTSQGSQIQANSFTASQGIQPYMTMNTNVTWSTFYAGWNPLEFNTSTANATLNASLNGANPISINPSDIISPTLQNNALGLNGLHWQNDTSWTSGNGTSGSIIQTKSTTINGEKAREIYFNTTNNPQGSYGQAHMLINYSSLPSINPSYDYITITGYTQVSTSISGYGFKIALQNETTAYTTLYSVNNTAKTTTSNSQITVAGSTPFFYSVPLKAFEKNGINFNTSQLKVMVYSQGVNTATVENYYMYITGMALTTSQISLGITSNGTTITGTNGNLNIAGINANFQYTKITNNGYSVATSQPLLNTTISQTAISNGSYIEEVQTQGQFKLPSAPDLTYGSANITEQLNVSSSQVLVLDINGLSYLSSISGKNGTINLIGSVNPTSSTSFLEIVEYTSSQWNSISGPPGFFSVAGVEYYFDEIVLGLTALLGIGGAAAHRRAAQLRRVK